jgi:hypothetical protein
MPPTPWPSVRRVDIPDAAPPYDCETHGAGCAAAPGMVLVVESAAGAARPGAAQSGEAQPREAQPGAAQSGAAQPGEVRAPIGAWPADAAGDSATAWPRQFAQVMVEILAGVRPATQVVPWTTDRVRARIRHLGPVLAADRRPVIKRIVTSRPTARVVEMTVIVSSGPRSRALAMRLEHVAARLAAPGVPARPARWLCTELEAG